MNGFFSTHLGMKPSALFIYSNQNHLIDGARALTEV